jgi:hypothetical protein
MLKLFIKILEADVKRGIGLTCQEMARQVVGYSTTDKTLQLCFMSAYQHLAHFYRYCFTHFTRHVHEMRGKVDDKVRNIMMSVASAEPVVDFEKNLEFIRSGKAGKKAAGVFRFVSVFVFYTCSLI